MRYVVLRNSLRVGSILGSEERTRLCLPIQGRVGLKHGGAKGKKLVLPVFVVIHGERLLIEPSAPLLGCATAGGGSSCVEIQARTSTNPENVSGNSVASLQNRDLGWLGYLMACESRIYSTEISHIPGHANIKREDIPGGFY